MWAVNDYEEETGILSIRKVSRSSETSPHSFVHKEGVARLIKKDRPIPTMPGQMKG